MSSRNTICISSVCQVLVRLRSFNPMSMSIASILLKIEKLLHLICARYPTRAVRYLLRVLLNTSICD